MSRRHWILAAAILLPTGNAQAQVVCPTPPSNRADGPPTLHLAASATVKVAPDELVADLSAVINGATPAAPQRHVNALMAAAAKAAGAVRGVKVAFRDYSVQYVTERPPHWTAQQTVELRGNDGESLLDLVGQLQGLGLALGGLDWQVSQPKLDDAHQEATISALRHLRAQASAAAAALGVQIDHYQSVRLDDAQAIPFGMQARPALAMMAAASPPPSATPTDQDVSASVAADIVLRATAIPAGKAP